MKFEEVLSDALDGKWVRPHASHRWKKLREDGLWDTYPPSKKPTCCEGLDCCIEEKEVEPKPMSPHFLRQDKWEVKPEEIIIWGSCDEDGRSFIHYDMERIGGGGGITNVKHHEIPVKNLFLSDNPRKYKIFPVED